MNNEFTNYDMWLQVKTEEYIDLINWMASWPLFIKFFMKNTATRAPNYYNARSFVTRNPHHRIAVEVKARFLVLTGNKWT